MADTRKFIRTDANELITFTHYMPFDAVHGMKKTEAELLESGGYLVDDIPTATDVPEGKIASTHYNPTKGFYFTYEDAPEPVVEDSPETLTAKVAALEESNETMAELLDQILMGEVEIA